MNQGLLATGLLMIISALLSFIIPSDQVTGFDHLPIDTKKTIKNAIASIVILIGVLLIVQYAVVTK